MFPNVNINIDNLIEKTETSTDIKLSRCFLFDFNKGDFVLQNGKLVVVEEIEALKVWIEKILRTEKFKFKVYKKENEDEYGTTIRNLLIGQKYPKGFIESELKREIVNALIKHPAINDISDFRTNREGSLLNIFFKVNLKNDTSFEQEVKF